VIGCGAIANELLDVIRANRLNGIDVQSLPALLHSTPHLIPDAVEQRIVAAGRNDNVTVFVAYGDCGTGGALDAVLRRHGVERLAGAHCYQFFMGNSAFEQEHRARPATFYMTDFLARHFDRLVWAGLGLDRHPELLETYFGNYDRVLFIGQRHDPGLAAEAAECAARLGLRFEHLHVGHGDLPPALISIRHPASDAA
jgi:hypothetical protein